MLSDQLK